MYIRVERNKIAIYKDDERLHTSSDDGILDIFKKFAEEVENEIVVLKISKSENYVEMHLSPMTFNVLPQLDVDEYYHFRKTVDFGDVYDLIDDIKKKINALERAITQEIQDIQINLEKMRVGTRWLL